MESHPPHSCDNMLNILNSAFYSFIIPQSNYHVNHFAFYKLNCPQSGCRSFPARIFILVSRKGAQRQRMSPCRCTFIGVESRGCQIKYTMRLNGGSCLPCAKIIAQNAASENRKCKSADKTYKNADFRLIERPIYIVCKNQKCYSFFENFLYFFESLPTRSAVGGVLSHFYQKPQIRKHIFPCYCPLAQTVV